MTPIPSSYKPWIILSLVILVGALILFAVDVTAGFLYFEHATPLWVIVLGVVAVLGVAAGFGGFFLLMLLAGWTASRESRRVQILKAGERA